MGKEDGGKIGLPSLETGTTEGTRTTEGRTETVSSNPATSEGGQPAKRGRGRPKGSTKKQSEKVTRLPSVVLDEPQEQTAPRRVDRPAAATTQKRNPNKNEIKQTFDLVSSMLVTSTNVLSLKFGSHWAFTESEAQAIAEPTARILDRLDLTETTGKYGDYVALLTAVALAVVPRVLETKHVNEQKTKVNPTLGGVKLVKRDEQQVRTNAGNDRTPVERPSSDGADGTKAILAFTDAVAY